MARTGRTQGAVSFEHRTGTACLDPGSKRHTHCTGRWIGSVSLGTDELGKRIRRKVTGRTRSDVTAKLKILYAELDQQAARPREYTVSDALDDWLAVNQREGESPSTAKGRDYAAQRLYRTLGHLKLRDLSEADVTAALEKLGQEVADSYLRRIHSTLKSVINLAQRRELVWPNVADHVTLPPGQPGRPSKAPSWSQAIAVEDKARAISPQFYPYLVLCRDDRSQRTGGPLAAMGSGLSGRRPGC